MNSLYYQSNQQTDFRTLVPLFVLILPIISFLGFIYATLTLFLPFIYVNFILTLAYGLLTAYLIETVLWFGKCRNEVHAIIIAALGGFFAIYVQWAIWLATFSIEIEGITITASEKFNLIWYIFIHPFDIFNTMKEMAQEGVWEIAGFVIKGGLLWSVWLMEAAIIIVVAIFRSGKYVDFPFCEKGNQWAKQIELEPLTSVPSPKGIEEELENKNYEMLQSLKPTKDELSSHAALTFFYCKTNQVYYLSINNKIVFIGRKEVKKIDNVIVEPIQIDHGIAVSMINQFKTSITFAERYRRLLDF